MVTSTPSKVPPPAGLLPRAEPGSREPATDPMPPPRAPGNLGRMIEVNHLSKSFGPVPAVRDLTFQVQPGKVTGFLGPNGAGKTTTLRLILGLNTPTSGTATVGGRLFRGLGTGLRHAGALLDAGDIHPGRSGYAHLWALARSNGLPRCRVDEVLAETGLTGAARRRAGTYSLGMRQRLGIAAALLGDPPVLLFDEPLNGLDPEGVRWIRTLLRRLAAEGRTVFVSSHLMSEMSHTADHLIVLGRGELIADEPLHDFSARSATGDLEDAFMELTATSTQYRAGGAR
jgi:ABC-2 type transport system ATP-binding protein